MVATLLLRGQGGYEDVVVRESGRRGKGTAKEVDNVELVKGGLVLGEQCLVVSLGRGLKGAVVLPSGK